MTAQQIAYINLSDLNDEQLGSLFEEAGAERNRLDLAGLDVTAADDQFERIFTALEERGLV